LLENTHKQIMRLPSIRQELNKDPYASDCDSDVDVDIVTYDDNRYKASFESIESRLNIIEQKYDDMLPALDMILNKINNINEELKSLKTSDNSIQKSNPLCNENITIHFEEPLDEITIPVLNPSSTISINNELEKIVEVEDEKLSDSKKLKNMV